MITVGIDGSDNALRALEWALDEATTRGRALRVIAAGDGTWTRAMLDESFASAAEDRDLRVPVTLDVLSGPPAAALVAESARSELLVIGRRGTGGFRALLAGSMVDACTQHARCPVVVVPADYQPTTTGRVIAAVDESDGGSAALRWAVQESLLRHRPLLAAMVYPASSASSAETEPLAAPTAAVLAELVDKAISDAGQPDLDVKSLPLKGKPAPMLLDLARPDDLIVVGCRGRSPFASTLLGSTSRVLLEHAPCPVVVAGGRH